MVKIETNERKTGHPQILYICIRDVSTRTSYILR